MELRSAQALKDFRHKIQANVDPQQRRIRVCDGTGCRALGSRKVLACLNQTLQETDFADKIEVMPTGCPGFCELGPLVTIDPERIAYNRVSVNDVPAIVAKTILQGEIIDGLVFVDPLTGQTIIHDHELPFYTKQIRRVLKLNGEIDPTHIEDYIAYDGYEALSKALLQMAPEQIIEEVENSGLRGRGGAGFSTGLKWHFCRESPGDVKYIICNADEGDPGAFMDRSILEGNPHSVVEGMIIGGYAIGATRGFVYIRNEYPLAVQNLRIALQQAHQQGLLGQNILGSGFDFDIEIRVGSGAFVCGEETALMASIEGKIGEPRPRPPYPAQSGLWGKPTNINNVKTWSNIPLIIRNGSEWFANIGTEQSKGTMIFSLVGNVRNTGLVEVPMGRWWHSW
jgi:NADH-quinone oxidoreductase subunit F